MSTAHDGVEGHEHGTRGVLELLVHPDAVGEGHAVLDAGQGGGPVAGPHLLAPTASTVPDPAITARTARWRAEDPPAHELSTFTIAALRRPALAQEGLSPDACLVAEPAGGGIAEHDQGDVGRVDRRVGQGIGHGVVGHLGQGEVAPAHGGDARADDGRGGDGGHVLLAHPPTVARTAGSTDTRRSNWLSGSSAVT